MRRIFLINGQLFESRHIIVRHPSDGYRPCRRIQYVPLKLGPRSAPTTTLRERVEQIAGAKTNDGRDR